MTPTIIYFILLFAFGVACSIAWMAINENIELRRDINRLEYENKYLKKVIESYAKDEGKNA